MTLDDVPVKHSVVFERLALKEVSEDSFQISIIRPVLKPKGKAVSEIISKLRGITTTQLVGVCGLLAFQNTLVLLLFSGGLKPLPRETAA